MWKITNEFQFEESDDTWTELTPSLQAARGYHGATIIYGNTFAAC